MSKGLLGRAMDKLRARGDYIDTQVSKATGKKKAKKKATKK